MLCQAKIFLFLPTILQVITNWMIVEYTSLFEFYKLVAESETFTAILLSQDLTVNNFHKVTLVE